MKKESVAEWRVRVRANHPVIFRLITWGGIALFVVLVIPEIMKGVGGFYSLYYGLVHISY
jgi:hypothetical protein